MKAERRHALQQNALAAKIVQLPNFGKIWLRRAIIAAVVVVIITLIVLLRINDAMTKRSEAQEFLAQAVNGEQMLRTRPPSSMSQPLDSQFMGTMQALYNDTREKLDQVEARSHDPAILSQALLVRADINLFMATLPRLPASTQPSIVMSPTPEEAFSEASTNYKKVLDQYSNQHLNMLAARLGLAALAEDHGDSKAAREQYQAIADDAAAPGIYLQQAKAELASLDKAAAPAMVAEKPIAPLIDPTKLPAPPSFPVLPSGLPSSRPASVPAATRATSRPAPATQRK